MYVYKPSNCCVFFSFSLFFFLFLYWGHCKPCRSCSCVVSCHAFELMFYEQIQWMNEWSTSTCGALMSSTVLEISERNQYVLYCHFRSRQNHTNSISAWPLISAEPPRSRRSRFSSRVTVARLPTLSSSLSSSLKPRPHQQQCRSNVRLCPSNIRLCCQQR